MDMTGLSVNMVIAKPSDLTKDPQAMVFKKSYIFEFLTIQVFLALGSEF